MMARDNVTRSPLVAGFMVASHAINSFKEIDFAKYRVSKPKTVAIIFAATLFNSPVGHDTIYQGLLRSWFAWTWLEASLDVGRLISFQEFRETAEFYVFDENQDVFGHRLRLLKDPFSFCLPFVSDDGDGQNPQKPIEACHAATLREDGKGGKKRPQNHCN